MEHVVCPHDHNPFTLDVHVRRGDRIAEGTLTCSACRRRYPIRDFVPRFVEDDSYVGSFSHEWTTFSRTQLDSVNGTSISLDYFRDSVGRTPDQLEGRLVLDAGCGTGRMLELFRDTGATVIGVDLSFAVDSAAANCAGADNIHVIQASIYDLPFRHGTFDFAYSIGVLHHTPDPQAAFEAVTRTVTPGGGVGVRLLDKRTIGGINVDPLFPLFLYRTVTHRLPPDRLLEFLRRYVPVACRLRRIPVAGQFFRWLLPVADYRGVHALDDASLMEWNILDTFDRFSPRYYFRYGWDEVRRWFESAAFEDVHTGTFPVSAYGRKKS